jgi:hypothetical protein
MLALSLLSLPYASGQRLASAKPNVSVAIEPEENGKLVYAHIVESMQGGPDGAKIAAKLLVTNNGSKPLTLEGATVEFLGPPFNVPINFNIEKVIGPGATATVHLSDEVNNPGKNYNIKLPHPTPVAVNFLLKFKNFAGSTVVYRQLAKHANDTPGGSYRHFGKTSDLGPGEFWAGASGFITGGHPNDERFAHDVGVVKWDSDDGKWTDKYPGADGCSKEDYLVWDKPVYALADGVVESVVDTNQDNEPEKCGNEVTDYGLNKVVVRHGDELVSYLHLRQGSAAVTVGQVVKAGTKVGHAGNSGSKTSHTHLHIHATKNGHLRPLHFKCVMVLDREAFDPTNPTAGPWVELDGRALPFEKTISWPSPDAGSAEIARHGIPASSYQNVVTNITSCGYMLCWVDGYEVNGKNYFNAIFRPAIIIPSEISYMPIR